MFLREPGRVFSTDFRKISQTGALTLPTEVEALGALPEVPDRNKGCRTEMGGAGRQRGKTPFKGVM